MMAALQHDGLLLSELLEDISVIETKDDCEISAIQIDSRLLGRGDLFVAMNGAKKHGLEFLSEVRKAGAVAVLYDQQAAKEFANTIEKYRTDLIMIAVDDVRKVAGTVASRFYFEPSKRMHIVAVTGTDGKTSVSRFLAQAMSSQTTSAVMGTTGNGIWGDIKPATHTTPDVLSLQKLLFDYERQQAKFIAMEVSSHGIDQQRVAGVNIDTAVLTNVSRDHLDYHGTVENYRAVKKQLFALASIKNRVINIDDETGKELIQQYAEESGTWCYGFDHQARNCANYIYVGDIMANPDGFEVALQTSRGDVSLTVPLLGEFNISNVLAVLAVELINDVAIDAACRNIETLTTAPGRMECFRAAEKASVVVDYAHTPKALELSLKALRKHFSGRIWCVFGCGGDRDKGKRALMAEQAELLSDNIVVTDDNPRNESNIEIVNQILSGFKNADNAIVIHDRQQAIEYACNNAAANDVVLVAGKGHEDYQIIGDIKKPFSDRKLVQRLIGGLQ